MSLPLTALLFYKSALPGCIAAFSALPAPAPPTQVVFAIRSHLALHPPSLDAARSLIDEHTSALGQRCTKALQAFASAIQDAGAGDLGTQVAALSEQYETFEDDGDESEHFPGEHEHLEALLATAQYLDDDPLGALETLRMGAASQRRLGSLALGVHLLLLVHRPDVAQREYEAARTWADDSVLIQLIEASLGLYAGGRAAQQAYYVYDEFSSVSSGSDEGKAARLAGMKLGRAVGLMRRAEWSRAQDEVREVVTTIEQDSSEGGGGGAQTGSTPVKGDATANQAVLALHLNPASRLANPGQEQLSALAAQAPPPHHLAASLAEMDKRFDDLVASRAVVAASAA